MLGPIAPRDDMTSLRNADLQNWQRKRWKVRPLVVNSVWKSKVIRKGGQDLRTIVSDTLRRFPLFRKRERGEKGSLVSQGAVARNNGSSALRHFAAFFFVATDEVVIPVLPKGVTKSHTCAIDNFSECDWKKVCPATTTGLGREKP